MKSKNPSSLVKLETDEQGIEAVMNNKQVRYTLVKQEGDYDNSYSTYSEFEKELNDKLKDGWNLCGGVSVGHIGNDHFCIEENIKWEYDVVCCRFFEYNTRMERALEALRAEVNKKCKAGWIPEGTIGFHKRGDTGCIYLCQNVIRPIIDSNVEEKGTPSERLYVRPPYDNITMTNEF